MLTQNFRNMCRGCQKRLPDAQMFAGMQVNCRALSDFCWGGWEGSFAWPIKLAATQPLCMPDAQSDPTPSVFLSRVHTNRSNFPVWLYNSTGGYWYPALLLWRSCMHPFNDSIKPLMLWDEGTRNWHKQQKNYDRKSNNTIFLHHLNLQLQWSSSHR